MLNRKFFSIFFISFICLIVLPVSAQTYTLLITKTPGLDLNFGSMVVKFSGPVVLSPTTGSISTTNVMIPSPIANNSNGAEFTITCSVRGGGNKSVSYTLSLSPTGSFNISKPPSTMQVGSFQISSSLIGASYDTLSTTRTVSKTACPNYSEVITLGATLSVQANQASGGYTSTVSIINLTASY